MKSAIITILLVLTSTISLYAQDPALPNWWQLNRCAALDYDYPNIGSCKITGATHLRARFRVPVGLTPPTPEMIEDPHGGIRLHTAWDVTYTTSYGTNHMDILGYLRQQNPPNGIWDLFFEVDIPIDTSDLWIPSQYSSRLINAWVEFQPFDGVEPAQLVMWQCRSGSIQLPGIFRENLPSTPPLNLCSGMSGP